MIRIGTIGTSAITERLVEAVAEVEGIELGSVYSRDLARAEGFVAKVGAGTACADLAELLGPANDAVYVASPNGVHAEQVRAAVRAGKHVLVEKPAVTTAALWDELVAEARDAGVVLLEGMRSAYDAGFAELRRLLGMIGTVRRVTFRYEKRSARYDLVLAGERTNMFDPALAGGALRDLGVYCVHPMVTLFGEPTAVMAACVPVPSGVDGAGVVLATYPGFVADLCFSKITTSSLPSEIQGERGTLLIDQIASPRRLTLQPHDGPERVVDLPGEEGSLTGEVARFVHLVESGDDPAADQDRTRATLAVMDQVRESWVEAG